MTATFSDHRTRLAKRTQVGLLVLAAYDVLQQSGDMSAPFLQEACFWWLTGIEEPGWKVLIDGARQHTTLVRPERSETQRIFDGEVDDQDMLARSGADDIIEARDFEQHLRNLARKHPLVYTVYDKTPHEFVLNPAQRNLHDTLTRIFPSVEDIGKQIHELRAIKSDDEIKAIKKAVGLTVKTFAAIRADLAEYTHEYELEAEFTKQFRHVNAQHAYEPIVAAGAHAVTLHYTANAGRIGAKDLMLIDIGARVNGYCADITRTYARNPTKRQRAVHAAVERAHQRIIALLGPDVLVGEYLREVDEIMKDALQEVGLLNDRSDNDTYRRYFPHAISHGLGVDVHDSLGAPRYFRPGMVLTVEPGIYLPEEGIGVRIEDDILITAQGNENLSRRLSTSL
jgi:Xaa-Pro aminopeptidase